MKHTFWWYNLKPIFRNVRREHLYPPQLSAETSIWKQLPGLATQFASNASLHHWLRRLQKLFRGVSHLTVAVFFCENVVYPQGKRWKMRINHSVVGYHSIPMECTCFPHPMMLNDNIGEYSVFPTCSNTTIVCPAPPNHHLQKTSICLKCKPTVANSPFYLSVHPHCVTVICVFWCYDFESVV